MLFDNLLYSVDEGVASVVLNRPEKRNAIDQAMIDDLHRAMDALEADETVRVMILSGAGGKALAAGADIAQLRQRRAREALQIINAKLFQRVEDLPFPTIAAITGYALGGGCELAMSCDMRVAGRSAKLGQPEVALGIIPAAGGTQRLPRLVGIGRAKEIIFTGRLVDADEAERIGLVNKLVDDDNVLDAAHEMAAQIAKQGGLAVRLAKIALNTSSRTGHQTGTLVEQLAQAVLFESQEKLDRMGAFLERQEARRKEKEQQSG
jgi:enoyl-CoA hydratase